MQIVSLLQIAQGDVLDPHWTAYCWLAQIDLTNTCVRHEHSANGTFAARAHHRSTVQPTELACVNHKLIRRANFWCFLLVHALVTSHA